MARTKMFDEAQTLDRAMSVFWQQGFEATSVRDLMVGAGISSSSLYATYGDKREIYLAALERYRAQERAEFAAILAEPRPLRALLAELFATTIDTLLVDNGRRGSFTLNAAIELGGRDPAVTAQLRAHFDDIGALLAGRLGVAQAGGELSTRFAPLDLAHSVMMGLYSLAMLAVVYPDRGMLERAAAVTLGAVEMA